MRGAKGPCDIHLALNCIAPQGVADPGQLHIPCLPGDMSRPGIQVQGAHGMPHSLILLPQWLVPLGILRPKAIIAMLSFLLRSLLRTKIL